MNILIRDASESWDDYIELPSVLFTDGFSIYKGQPTSLNPLVNLEYAIIKNSTDIELHRFDGSVWWFKRVSPIDLWQYEGRDELKEILYYSVDLETE